MQFRAICASWTIYDYYVNRFTITRISRIYGYCDEAHTPALNDPLIFRIEIPSKSDTLLCQNLSNCSRIASLFYHNESMTTGLYLSLYTVLPTHSVWLPLLYLRFFSSSSGKYT